jgi:methionine-rich copper-binding protein CopC
MKPIASALLVTGLVTAFLVTAALPASAHDSLIASTPAAGETLTALPDAFSVTMNEDLLDLDDKGSGFGILVQDSAGLYYGDGCVSVSGPSMSTAAALGAPGEYTFTWQVVSSDGHPTSDKFTFRWAPAGDFAPAVGSKQPGDCNGQYVRDGGAASPASPVVDSTMVFAVGGGALVLIAAVAIALLIVRRKK